MFLRKERIAYTGLGDRFLQMLIGFAYAIDLNAPLLNVLPELESPSEHGDYDWANDFFRLDVNLVKMTLKEATRTIPQIEIPNEVNKTTLYEQKIAALQDKCNVVISVNPAHVRLEAAGARIQHMLIIVVTHTHHDTHIRTQDCSWTGTQQACYAAQGPALYEKARNVLACGFLQTDRAKLPRLRFNLDAYNVVIHLRVGDMVLHGGDPFSNPFLQRDPALQAHNASGEAYYSMLKRELDQVLGEFDRIHYIFIDEEPEAGEDGPPEEFAFLSDIPQRRRGRPLGARVLPQRPGRPGVVVPHDERRHADNPGLVFPGHCRDALAQAGRAALQAVREPHVPCQPGPPRFRTPGERRVDRPSVHRRAPSKGGHTIHGGAR